MTEEEIAQLAIQAYSEFGPGIKAIKRLRALVAEGDHSYLSLREAKDACDIARDGPRLSPDRENFVRMLEVAKIEYQRHMNLNTTSITIHARQEHVGGYSGCCAEFTFRPDGSLESMGVWE